MGGTAGKGTRELANEINLQAFTPHHASSTLSAVDDADAHGLFRRDLQHVDQMTGTRAVQPDVTF
jgi:hypothetical protein